MATANSTSRKGMTKGRAIMLVIALLVVILAAVFAYNYSFISGQLKVGTSYGARVACSCHFVGGRDLDDCYKDFEPGMELIGLSVDNENRRVSASVPLLASATAEFREGWGCVMLDENEPAAD